MRVARLILERFRGIKRAVVLLPKHGVLIGDNNTGKTTILEALDLVLGPDRLNRQPAIDEHDFFRGEYTPNATGGGGMPEGSDDAAVVEVEGLARPEEAETGRLGLRSK